MTFQHENLSEQNLDALTESDMMLIAEQLNAIEPGGTAEAVSQGLLLSDSLWVVGAIVCLSLAAYGITKLLPTLKKIDNRA